MMYGTDGHGWPWSELSMVKIGQKIQDPFGMMYGTDGHGWPWSELSMVASSTLQCQISCSKVITIMKNTDSLLKYESNMWGGGRHLFEVTIIVTLAVQFKTIISLRSINITLR